MQAPVQVDLLVVGGSEVSRFAIVDDINSWGGQFSSEGVVAIDEWTL